MFVCVYYIMICKKLYNKKLFLKEYVICPFCGLKIQEINNNYNQKTHCCGNDLYYLW